MYIRKTRHWSRQTVRIDKSWGGAVYTERSTNVRKIDKAFINSVEPIIRLRMYIITGLRQVQLYV